MCRFCGVVLLLLLLVLDVCGKRRREDAGSGDVQRGSCLSSRSWMHVCVDLRLPAPHSSSSGVALSHLTLYTRCSLLSNKPVLLQCVLLWRPPPPLRLLLSVSSSPSPPLCLRLVCVFFFPLSRHHTISFVVHHPELMRLPKQVSSSHTSHFCPDLMQT